MTSHSTARPHKPAAKVAPQYKADNGPLSTAQLRQIKEQAPQGIKHSLQSSLLDRKRSGK